MNKLLTAGFILFLMFIYGCYIASSAPTLALSGQSAFYYTDDMHPQLMILSSFALTLLVRRSLE
jgi:hypothetical protein